MFVMKWPLIGTTTILILLLLFPLCLCPPVQAGQPVSEAAVQVFGDALQPGRVRLSELVTMGPITVPFTMHGEKHQVTGVRLDKVLARFGFAPGKMGKDVPPSEKRSGFRKVIVASAPDGFQAVFSGAELSADMGPTQVLLVWQMDGKPLPAGIGPLRLVVPTDSEPSRCIHQVQRLDVVDMRRIVPPPGTTQEKSR